jgi:methionine synthase / methylenetetrahydrofolate reductase(NADPH)
VEGKERKPLPETPPSAMKSQLDKRFLVAVEMDVPRGLNLEKLLKGAQNLKEAGVDIINISDGARARLRMNPTAVCTLLQQQVGLEVTMHFACRDRNLLAVQSDLLGAHALGIRNILAVTGDPANIGDYPSATSVFDIDSIGLCQILKRFNDGIDLAGYTVGTKTGFTVCCAYNPNAIDQPGEDDRLRRKLDAGAECVYTQPVFDEEDADHALDICQKLGLPVLVGVLPLRSQRHAEFMNNEVPGIRIPDRLMQAISDAPDDASALEIGLAESRKLSLHIAQGAAGLYLMPPFGNDQIARDVVAAIRS